MQIIDIEKYKQVKPEMLWRGATLDQLDAFEKTLGKLAQRFRIKAEVVGSHRSKSIDLPVVKITTDAGEFTLRDNFYDINLMAILRQPSTLSLDQLFEGIQEPLTWDWYLSEIERARNYSWREWTDEEMNDPRILRVRDKREGVNTWWDKKAEEKERWANRMTSPEWYSEDWSNDEFSWDGTFGPGVKLYRQSHAFAQGISVTTKNEKYQKGISDFIIATDTLTSASMMIERLSTAGSR